ncbi:MAG: hypothetical protein K2K21_05075 [Lachnospiraceae bacterium]|nr:hypothetical protein [Lachnospiraceae bacterium]
MVEQNTDNGDVTLRLSATDYDSGMLYYTYSYDGGQTFSELQRWPDKKRDTFEFTINVPSGITPQIAVNAYNGYDLYTTSNTLYLTSLAYEEEKPIEEDVEDADNAEDTNDFENIGNNENTDNNENMETTGNIESAGNTENASEASSGSVISKDDIIEITLDFDNDKTKEQPITISYFLKVSLVCVFLIVAMVFSMVLILRGYKRKRR